MGPGLAHFFLKKRPDIVLELPAEFAKVVDASNNYKSLLNSKAIKGQVHP